MIACVHSKMKQLSIADGAIYCSPQATQTDSNKVSHEYAKARYPEAVEDGSSVESLKIAFEQLTQGTNLTLDQLKRAVRATASEKASCI